MEDEKKATFAQELARLDAENALSAAPRVPMPLASPREDPARVYLGGFASRKTRSSIVESVDRIAVALDRRGAPIAWEKLDHATTMRVRAELLARYRPATVRLTLSVLRGILRTAWRMGLVSAEEVARATDWPKLRAVALPAGRDLSKDEIRALGKWAAKLPGAYGVFIRACFALLIGAGLRASELGDLPIGAYSAGPPRAIRFVRKGTKESIVPLGDVEADAVEAWLRLRRRLGVGVHVMLVRVTARGRVFRDAKMRVDTVEHICETAAKAAGVARFTPHDCRRTFATQLLSSDVDLGTVQRLMGHTSPETTARYDRRQELEDARVRTKVTLWTARAHVPEPEAEIVLLAGGRVRLLADLRACDARLAPGVVGVVVGEAVVGPRFVRVLLDGVELDVMRQHLELAPAPPAGP